MIVFLPASSAGRRRCAATRRRFRRCRLETKEVSSMPVSNLTLVERIARVLAGRYHSINADGDDPSAGPNVDETWHEYIQDALSILRTMREPDQVMAAAGDPGDLGADGRGRAQRRAGGRQRLNPLPIAAGETISRIRLPCEAGSRGDRRGLRGSARTPSKLDFAPPPPSVVPPLHVGRARPIIPQISACRRSRRRREARRRPSACRPSSPGGCA